MERIAIDADDAGGDGDVGQEGTIGERRFLDGESPMRNCIRRGPSSRRIHKQAFFLRIEEDSLYLREDRVLLIDHDIHEGFTPDERTLPYGSDTGRNGDAGKDVHR